MAKENLTGPISVEWPVDDGNGKTAGPAEILFCVARLDNRLDLIKSLGCDPDLSDPELILKTYYKHQTDCPDRLLGDFAFAIRDPVAGHIFAARDFMGCQPVYYCVNEQHFAIAERLEQLLDFRHVPGKPNKAFILTSLKEGFADHHQTYFDGIFKIPAGHFFILRETRPTLQSYWKPEAIKERKWEDHESCLNEFRSLLKQAVRDRLPKNENIGVHVSGGLDCSSLAVLATEELASQNRPPPAALSWYPPPRADHDEFEKSEYRRIEALCDRIGSPPIYTVQTKENILEVLRRDHMARPICNASYNEHQVLKEAHQRGVTTILSGFGGDEAASFDGRGYWERLALSGRWIALGKFAKANGQNPVRFCLSRFANGLSQKFLSDAALNKLEEQIAEQKIRFWKAVGNLIFPFWRAARLSQVAEQEDWETESYASAGLKNSVVALPSMPRIRIHDDKIVRCQLLRWSPITARMESWAADGDSYGIRYTYPLLDRRVVEFALSVPGHLLRDKKWKRLLFRQAMDPYLPAEVCWEHAKSDPARANPLIEAMKIAYIAIGEQLNVTSIETSNMAYLDMERFKKDLDAKAVQKRKRLGRLIQAMELLGTKELGLWNSD